MKVIGEEKTFERKRKIKQWKGKKGRRGYTSRRELTTTAVTERKE